MRLPKINLVNATSKPQKPGSIESNKKYHQNIKIKHKKPKHFYKPKEVTDYNIFFSGGKPVIKTKTEFSKILCNKETKVSDNVTYTNSSLNNLVKKNQESNISTKKLQTYIKEKLQSTIPDLLLQIPDIPFNEFKKTQVECHNKSNYRHSLTNGLFDEEVDNSNEMFLIQSDFLDFDFTKLSPGGGKFGKIKKYSDGSMELDVQGAVFKLTKLPTCNMELLEIESCPSSTSFNITSLGSISSRLRTDMI